ncbi:hypothetical protein KORDIASMS9_04073 [Kordia sp. SMS9]|uniref:hypothetical protein n=1 Tax=Kordia sp. SMS9 TaxID=2282170 RepID=UPI000E0D98AE|nr:hypothetical protein [Kordia sp. SMS9]AXG71815.1 hypothetical protein KORDIASMS9_04073 [Kordia sp. SMS9]
MQLEKILKLGKTLSKTEQRTILGGTTDELNEGTGTCAAFAPCRIPGKHDSTCQGGKLIKDVSRAEAEAHVVNGGHWCCEGCSAASWYH